MQKCANWYLANEMPDICIHECLPGEAVRAIIPYEEKAPASNLSPSFPASTSTFPLENNHIGDQTFNTAHNNSYIQQIQVEMSITILKQFSLG